MAILIWRYSLIICALIVIACKQISREREIKNSVKLEKNLPQSQTKIDTTLNKQSPVPLAQLNDSIFVRLADYSNDFVYDMKYATTDNFLKAQVYECGECYMRVATAKALISANISFIDRGFRIKFFDCYRPHDVQKKMWEIVPNPTYVANPAKGSVHNRGGAVDITLVDLKGNEVAMGTTFDFFGPKARHSYKNLPKEVLQNRKILKEVMEATGFRAIASEWWHYNYPITLNYEVSNFLWECNNY